MGEGGLDLEQAVVDEMRIAYLLSGRAWPYEVRRALRDSGAVTGCLSRSVLRVARSLVEARRDPPLWCARAARA